MSITLHIERLVLDEALLASSKPGPVAAAIRAELERLLAVEGLAPDLAGGARASLSGGSLQFGPGVGSQELGARVGRAVHGALRPPGESHAGGSMPVKP